MRAPRPRTHSCRSRAATWLNQVSGIRSYASWLRVTEYEANTFNDVLATMPCRALKLRRPLNTRHSAPIADPHPESCPLPSLAGMPCNDPLSNAPPKRYAVLGFDLHESNRGGVSLRCLFAWNALLCISVTQTRMTFAGELL